MDNENNQTSSPMQNRVSTPTSPGTSEVPFIAPKKEKETGATVGIVIIVIILVLGGLYVWGARVSKTPDVTTGIGPGGQTAEDITAAGDPATDNLNTQGTSDELNAIEDDLDATLLDGLDAEVNVIDIELQ